MFKKPFSFEGRIRRLEYGLSLVIYGVAAVIISGMTEADERNSIFALVLLPFIWFMIAQGAKRCHDRGHSGWYQIIPLYFLWLLFAEGEWIENEYGPNPKGIESVVED